MPETRIDRMGGAALRDHSSTQIEAAIGKALSELTGENLEVAVVRVDFGGDVVLGNVEMEIVVRQKANYDGIFKT